MKKIFSISMLFLATYSFSQKLFIVKSDERFGLINESGIEVIPPKYNSIEDYDKAHPNWAKVELENLFGFVDRNGKIVVEPKYELIKEYNEYNQGWALVKKDGRFGFINNDGKEVVPPFMTR
jgi:hypothetical protein